MSHKVASDTGQFTEFFVEATGHRPFSWQVELALRLLRGDVPKQIDVPTGLGKTASILAWAYALAASLEGDPPGGGMRPPVRLFFVADRRIIVDSTYEVARRLASLLQAPPPDKPVVARVARALQSLAGADAVPLSAVRMRGGALWDSLWLDRPNQPAVVVSTVDQYGSRLFFRGYGVTPSLMPVNAALCGSDAWLLIDEAHIAEPLVESVGRVAALQTPEADLGLRPLVVTAMSATLNAAADADTLRARLETETAMSSPAAEVARLRLSVAKPASLKCVQENGKGTERFRHLGVALADLARSQFGETPGKYGIVCNTVQAARAAFESLRRSLEDGATLLTGRVREFEREQLTAVVLDKFGSGAPSATSTQVLVATQTVEVGADLDVDALVTECAPLSSLVQRFGRVRRLGNEHASTSSVVYCPGVHDDDPIYGEATKSTWNLLVESAGNGKLDLGYSGVTALRDVAGMTTEPPRPFLPVLLGAHIERWVQTSPIPAADQAVAPFLHGFDAPGLPQVFIAWRGMPASVSGSESVDHWEAWLDLAPVSGWELVAVPLREARAFIAGIESDVAVTDIELGTHSYAKSSPASPTPTRVARAVILPGTDRQPILVTSPDDVTPFATLVVAADEGGHDSWGWNGHRRGPAAPLTVADVADLVPARGRRSVRVAPSIAASHSPAHHSELGDAWMEFDPDDPMGTLPAVLGAFASLIEGPQGALYEAAREGLLRGTWEALLTERDSLGRWTVQELNRPIVRVAERFSTIRTEASDQSDDDEITTSLTGRAAVRLLDHGEAVGRTAREFADRLGLDSRTASSVELAARYHDLGKADRRFQAVLYDANVQAAAAGELRAKSGHDPRDPVARHAWQLVGLPRGFRHEAVSGRLLRALMAGRPELFDGLDFDLIHHLVVAHHGRSRPLLPPTIDRQAPSVELSLDESIALSIDGEELQVDWDHPRIFEALNDRYGWWGLAMLETIVRLADMRESGS